MSETSKSSSKNPRAKRDTGPEAKPVIEAPVVETRPIGGVTSTEVVDLVPTADTQIVATPSVTQVSIEPLKQPAEDDEFGGSGDGFENREAADNIMPAVSLLQSNSPEVQEAAEKGLQSPRAGDFIVKMTGQIIDGKKGFRFLPVYAHKRFVHWNKRPDKGGNGKGFIAEYEEKNPFVQDALKGIDRVMSAIDLKGQPGAETELVETKTLFGLLVDDDGQTYLATIPCQSTKLSAFKSITTAMYQFRHPGRPGALNMYNFWLRATSFLDTNKRTNMKFYKLRLGFDGEGGVAKTSLFTKSQNPELFLQAMALHEDCAAGRKVAETVVDADEGVADAAGDGGGYRAPAGGGAPPPPDGKNGVAF